MSQTRSRAEERPAGPTRAFQALTRMVEQGRSWSGRERNCVFLNTGTTGGGRFATISAASGLDFPDDGRAAALTDWDQDGDLDLWLSNRNAPRLRFLRNDLGASRFLALRLQGNGVTTNRDAIGARVEVVVEGLSEKLRKTLRAGEGFLAQSSKWIHFGLGGAERISRVVVHWPGGQAEEFGGLEPGRRYELVQGARRAREWSRPGSARALAPSTPHLPAEIRAARVPLISLISLPRMDYEGFDGSRLPLRVPPGRHLLLNLWSSWCAPCREELADLAAREKEIRGAGIEVLSLTVDGLGDDRSDPAAARDLLTKLRFPFSGGRASAGLIHMFQYLHDGLLTLHRPLPIPASFLVDPAGRLSVIYKGRLRIDDLLADLGHSGRSRAERRARAAALPGRTIEHELVERASLVEETKSRFQLALDLEKGGLLEDAMVQYREVLELRPDFAEARNNLGLLLSRKGELKEAAQHYREALRLRPAFAEAHFNRGLLLEVEGNLEEAKASLREALRLRPDYPGAHDALGLLHAKEGKIAEARAQFEEEVRLHPDSAEAHNHLGLAFLDQGRNPEARASLGEALRLQPENADARNNLGVALRRLGHLEEAAAQYAEAIRLQPGFAEAHNNLGALRQTQGKLIEARMSFERALEIRPDFTAARSNLERVQAQISGPRPGG